MATEAKRYPYVIMYNDLSNVMYELTKKEFDTLAAAVAEGKNGIVIPDIGVLVLKDVRSVIRQIVEEPEATESADPPVTPEELQWIKNWRELSGEA